VSDKIVTFDRQGNALGRNDSDGERPGGDNNEDGANLDGVNVPLLLLRRRRRSKYRRKSIKVHVPVVTQAHLIPTRKTLKLQEISTILKVLCYQWCHDHKLLDLSCVGPLNFLSKPPTGLTPSHGWRAECESPTLALYQ